MTSSSSLLCQFLLISVVVIGTILMIMPNVQALECYSGDIPDARSAVGGPGRAAWKSNKMFRISNGRNANPLMVPIGDGQSLKQCPAEYPWCSTVHCDKIYGAYTSKSCAKLIGDETPEEICENFRKTCARGDPKFYCRYCNKDKCNDE